MEGGRLREVALVCLKVGTLGFGGPAAHIALLREEAVVRRGWLDERTFLSYVGAANLVPGPTSTELALHIGLRRAGWRGLLVAGACFILPAVLLVAGLAALYERHGTSGPVDDLRYALLPVVVGVVAHALAGLARSAAHRPATAVLAAAAALAYLAGAHQLLVLLVAGAAAGLWAQRRRLLRSSHALAVVALPLGAGDLPGRPPPGLARLFLVFLEIGGAVYGSGYVLLAFLQRELVDTRGWLTTREVLDAVAVGQVTPGPLFSTATFLGWQVDGPAGAAVATVGIFLPSFAFVGLLRRIVPWMEAHPRARAFLDGVAAASLGLMGGVLVDLARAAILDVATAALAAIALVLLLTRRVGATPLLAAGVALGTLRAAA